MKGRYLWKEPIGDENAYPRIAQFEKELISSQTRPTPSACSPNTGRIFATTPREKTAHPERRVLGTERGLFDP
jgi:hypothetical protein